MKKNKLRYNFLNSKNTNQLDINIVFPSKPANYGGVGTFQKNITSHFLERGFSVSHGKIDNGKKNIILVMGGTRRLLWLYVNKLKGIPIIHRLDGKNWQHWIENKNFEFIIRSEFRLFILRFIRRFIADGIIYQSNFIRDWWQSGRIVKKRSVVIKNGTYRCSTPSEKKYDVICVEGELNGLPAYTILQNIQDFSVIVLGGYEEKLSNNKNINFKGKVTKDVVRQYFDQSKVFVNLETNPPCPNSMIEALSHGLPVISIDNGSAKEIIGDAGILIDQSNDPWQFNIPNDLSKINEYISTLINSYEEYSSKALARFERNFLMTKVGDDYLSFLKSFLK